MTDAVTVGALPWYKSPQTIGLVTTAVSAFIALSPKLGTLLGLNSPTAVENAVTVVFGFIAFVAPVIGTIVRSNSKLQPITLTQAAADAHPASVAVEAAEAAPILEAPIPMPAPMMSTQHPAQQVAALPLPASHAPPPPPAANTGLKPWGHST
jgi:hypothetical protein